MVQVRKINLTPSSWSDERGWGINPAAAAGRKDGTVGNLHAVSIRPGAERGNHHHPDATEWLLVFGGPGRIAWRPIGQDAIHREDTDGTRPVLYEIPPNVEHAVTNPSDREIYLIAFTDSPNYDTIRGPSLF